MQNLEENLPRRLTDKSYGIPFNHYSANTALIKLRWRCICRRTKTKLTARPPKRADLNNADNDIQ